MLRIAPELPQIKGSFRDAKSVTMPHILGKQKSGELHVVHEQKLTAVLTECYVIEFNRK